MKRSKWKGPLISKKIKNLEKKTFLPRHCEITSKMIGSSCFVYNGQKFIKLILNNTDMVGYKLGAFVFTRVVRKKNN